MKIRTFFVDVFRFVLLCLVLMILIPLAVHADPCATYQSDYDSKDTAYRAAMDNLLRANVAVEKNTPYGSVPSTYKDLEKEYEKNPGGFLKTLKQGLDVHPNMPTKTGAFIDTALNFINVANIRKARSDAVIALGVAKAAREAAKKALENCKGRAQYRLSGVNVERPARPLRVCRVSRESITFPTVPIRFRDYSASKEIVLEHGGVVMARIYVLGVRIT